MPPCDPCGAGPWAVCACRALGRARRWWSDAGRAPRTVRRAGPSDGSRGKRAGEDSGEGGPGCGHPPTNSGTDTRTRARTNSATHPLPPSLTRPCPPARTHCLTDWAPEQSRRSFCRTAADAVLSCGYCSGRKSTCMSGQRSRQ